MAHFALIDDNSIVQKVLVVPDEQEHRGQEFLADDLGLGGTWIQTSYTSREGNRIDPATNDIVEEGQHFRFNFAAIGSTWDANFGDDGAFIPPMPEEGEWVVDPLTASWVLVSVDPEPEPE